MTSSDVLIKLEYGEILRRLATHCSYSVAAARAREIGPSRDRKVVRHLLDVTAEAVDFGIQFPEFSIGGARDIRSEIEKADKGGRLTPHELLQILDTLRAGREVKRTFTRLPDVQDRYPNLLDYAEAIDNFSPLETDLARSIGPRGDVLDSASEELARLRKTVRIAHNRLMDRLNSFISGGRYGSALQENIITVRDGRYVIPVRAEARGLIRGIVHDTSASGHTLFVEPFDVVELNNRWREQQLAETHEIERILDILSGTVGDQRAAIERLIEAVAAIDLALAKARLAAAMEANRPALHEPAGGRRQDDGKSHPTHRVRLENARHPLLDPARVVPISLELGESFRVLLITGPNTGGKTVALKTVGLLTLMAQTGLFIPADDTSVMSVFSAVYVDIGDEQSIEQSLSTFSSHITNIVRMLGQVAPDSLVLLDEVGAGTDPQEGSALARALMSSLLDRGALVMATTHYSEVKAFAYATPGVENASVEFDIATLSPTYRLTVGIPGRSNALAIASRLGMPAPIVDEARTLLDPGDGRTEQLIEQIRQRRDDITEQLRAARQAEEEARTLRRRAAQSIREADQIRRTARDEAIAEVESELATAREAIRELERAQARVPTSRPERTVSSEAVETAEREIRLAQRRKKTPAAAPVVQSRRPLRRGDLVTIVSLDQKGEVLSVDGTEAEIQMGSLKLRQPVGNLERIGRARQESSPQRTIAPAAAETVPIEIDLRGYRAEEIAPILERYIHDAYLSGLPWVRIIHGKGTGALRQVVREELRGHPVVDRSAAAGSTEGGEGATVAHLRQG
ncbi:MAG: endonuclease MutS2 [Chloroflexia bacterium]|nr:endonuclease MutS2 [Chloroflexia bacterium]